MIYTFATEKTSGISSLGLSLKAFIFQLVTFVIIMWILNKYALSKIFKTIAARRSEIENSLVNAEKAKKELAEADEKADEILQNAHKKADLIASDASKEAAQILKDSEDKAEQKVERLLTESREQIKQDVIKARLELKAETAVLVAAVAGSVIDEKLNADGDARLIDKKLRGAEQ